MISSRQIRAARALLNWTQSDLAKASGLHINAVNKIENENGAPRTATLARLHAVFETSNIRFRGLRGVEVREDVFEIQRFEGVDAIRRMTDDIISIVRGKQDEVLNCIADEYLFNSTDSKQVERYFAHKRKTGFRERYIVHRNSKPFRGKDAAYYRWLPDEAMGKVSYFVYADRVAMVQWQVRQILVIKNAALAETFSG
jgi:transcriptional regulator with XRE-family HTH domain